MAPIQVKLMSALSVGLQYQCRVKQLCWERVRYVPSKKMNSPTILIHILVLSAGLIIIESDPFTLLALLVPCFHSM